MRREGPPHTPQRGSAVGQGAPKIEDNKIFYGILRAGLHSRT